MFLRKQAIETWYNFPSRLTGISALPCKTRNMKITPFRLNVVCCFANKHKTRQNNHLFINRLSFIYKTIKTVCKKQDQTGHTASSHLICTQSAFAMSVMISGAMSIVGVFFG